MEEFPYVLWSYKTIIHTNTIRTPFRLTFRKDAVIPMEIRQTSDRVINYSEEVNNQVKVENLDFVDDDRKMAYIQLVAYKEKIK